MTRTTPSAQFRLLAVVIAAATMLPPGALGADGPPGAAGTAQELAERSFEQYSAAELLESTRPAAIRTLRERLENGTTGDAIDVAHAISAMDASPPPPLIAPLSKRLEQPVPEAQLAILRALARYSERQAVAGVMSLLEADAPTTFDVRRRVFETLVAQTGRPDLANSRDRWHDWWEGVRFVPEMQWRAILLQNHLAFERSLTTEIGALRRRLQEVYRRLHLQTPVDERSAVIEELIRDEDVALRIAGIDLATRAILNAQPVSDGVLEAAADALEDTAPTVRAGAASLLGRVDRDDLEPRLYSALSAEIDPIPAAALLNAVARRPRDVHAPLIERWLLTEQGARGAAVAAYARLAAAGYRPDPETRRRIIFEFAPDPGGKVSLEEGTLLVHLGFLTPVINQLSSADDAVALHAAQALSSRGEGGAYLLDATRRRPDLFLASAGECATRFSPDAATFLELLDAGGARAVDEAGLTTPLRNLADALPPGELVRAAESIDGARMRASLLRRAAGAEFHGAESESPARTSALVLLVEAHLELGDGRAALETLSGVPDVLSPEIETPLRVWALLLTREFEAARDATDPLIIGPRPWFGALASAQEVDERRLIAGIIRELYAEGLDEEQRGLLRDAEAPTVDSQPDASGG